MAKIDFDPKGVEPLSRALFGDYRMLAARIRDGSAGQQERNFASDLLEGKRKRPAHRTQTYETFKRNLEIYNLLEGAKGPDGRWVKKDAAVRAAEKAFNVSETTVHEAYREISLAIGAAHSDN